MFKACPTDHKREISSRKKDQPEAFFVACGFVSFFLVFFFFWGMQFSSFPNGFGG